MNLKSRTRGFSWQVAASEPNGGRNISVEMMPSPCPWHSNSYTNRRVFRVSGSRFRVLGSRFKGSG